MGNEILTFDAAASNIDGTDPGTALLMGPGTPYALRAFDAPTPSQTVQWTGSVDTDGSLPASRKHENRQVTMTIMCATLTALRTLQAKVGKIALQGGTLKWATPDGVVVIFDLHSADTFAPTIDVTYYKNAGAYGEVQIAVVGRPYGHEAEITLSDHVETTLPWLTFTEATVKGDVPGLGRLVIDDDQAAARRVVFWGIQCRNYSAASTAALAYQAEACSLVSGSTAVGPTGSSGAGSNIVQDLALDIYPGFHRLCVIGASATAQTHVGNFRVLARVYVPVTNGGKVAVRMAYQPYVGANEIDNDWVWLTTGGTSADLAISNGWMWADLGIAALPQAGGGNQGWLGWFDAASTVLNDDAYVDSFLLFPLDEGYGEAIVTSNTQSVIPTSGSLTVRYDGVFGMASTGYWFKPHYEGDYLNVPQSGLESRTVRVLVLAEEGATSAPIASAFVHAGRLWNSGSIDDVSARLFYTPRYLVVPGT